MDWQEEALKNMGVGADETATPPAINKFDWLKKIENFQDIQLHRGDKKVQIEYCDEGYNGEFDPNDPEDVPLLRFSCFKLLSEWGNDGREYESMDSASYCTQLPVDTPFAELCDFARKVMDAIQEKEYKNKLEELSLTIPKEWALIQEVWNTKMIPYNEMSEGAKSVLNVNWKEVEWYSKDKMEWVPNPVSPRQWKGEAYRVPPNVFPPRSWDSLSSCPKKG